MVRSTSHWPPLHSRLGGYSEEMARFIRPKIYTRHRDRRAWNESAQGGPRNQCVMAHIWIRCNGQPHRQDKRSERSATRPTSHFRSVYVGKWCRRTSIEVLQALANKANIDYDHFIRTSEPDHRSAVQAFWVCTTATNRHAPTNIREAHASRTRLDLC